MLIEKCQPIKSNVRSVEMSAGACSCANKFRNRSIGWSNMLQFTCIPMHKGIDIDWLTNLHFFFLFILTFDFSFPLLIIIYGYTATRVYSWLCWQLVNDVCINTQPNFHRYSIAFQQIAAISSPQATFK